MTSPDPAPATPGASPDLAARFAATAFHAPFRRYQLLALDAFERQRAGGDSRFYITMPPGSGKTVVGLEMARRLARPTLVLGPTTAIEAQWLAEWAAFEPGLVEASPTADLATPVTVLTYQSLAVLERDADGDDTDADGRPIRSSHDRRRERVLIARGGERDQVLGLLHENGRAIIERLAALGPVTLVLDECHHLLALWGHVLEAVVGELHPESTVIGLTATPPTDLLDREAALYRRLFGLAADFETVTPAVVKDGYLAPYQELAYLARPTEAEERWMAHEQERFDELLADLLDPAFATVSFGAWFATRVVARRTREGAPVSWSTLEHDAPALARAALRWLWKQDASIPPGAHLREEHRRAPDAADWIALIDGYCTDVLTPSAEPYDHVARERIRRALPSVGYVLTRRGIRAGTSAVDRVLGLSAAKAWGAIRILEAEHAVLGDRLRAVVLCDFAVAGREISSSLRGVLDPGTGSAAATLRDLLAQPSTAGLDPVLVSGRTVAAGRATALKLVEAAMRDASTAHLFRDADPFGDSSRVAGWEDVVVLDPGHPEWSARRWVPLVTAFFEGGGSRCLVGTRALLGEGWNSRKANVLVDLGAATTSVSVQQVRGRTLRLDPDDPGKVADNWDVVVVAGDRHRGSADYDRFVRKHGHDFALSEAGEIESGVSHVDPALGPFGPPPAERIDVVTTSMLARVARRSEVRSAWQVGVPYRDVAVQTIRIRSGRPPGLPGRRLLRAGPAAASGGPDPLALFAVGSAGAAGVAAVGLVAGIPVVGGIGAVAVGAVAGLAAIGSARARLAGLVPSDTFGDMASALADALAASGLVDRELDARSVRIVAQPDGYYRGFLDGADDAAAILFTEALAELLEPLWDPRWIISRRVDTAPETLADTAALLLSRTLPGSRGAEIWHAVPSILARRRDRVAAFEAAWRRWIGPGARAIRADDPRAQAVLAVHAGEDPFRIETQIRTLWT